MAKKTSVKSKSAPVGKKTSKKAAAKKPAPSASKPSGGPKKISTGAGPGPKELGEVLVREFNKGKFDLDHKWSPAIESIEGMGMSWSGRKAVDAKNAEWYKGHTLHGASAEGPFVGATGFAVKFKMDIEEKATAKRIMMEEVAVYSVSKGKIVREEFMYGSMTPVGG